MTSSSNGVTPNSGGFFANVGNSADSFFSGVKNKASSLSDSIKSKIQPKKSEEQPTEPNAQETTPAVANNTIGSREIAFCFSGKDIGSEKDALWTAMTNSKDPTIVPTVRGMLNSALGALKYFGSYLKSFVAESEVGKAHKKDKAFEQKVAQGFKPDPKVQHVFNTAMGDLIDHLKDNRLILPDAKLEIPLQGAATPDINAQQGALNIFKHRVDVLTGIVVDAAKAKGHFQGESLKAYVDALDTLVRQETNDINETTLCRQYKDAVAGHYIPHSMLAHVVEAFAKGNMEELTSESFAKYLEETKHAFSKLFTPEIVYFEVLAAIGKHQDLKMDELMKKFNFNNVETLKAGIEKFKNDRESAIEKLLKRLAELRGTNGDNGLVSQSWEKYVAALKEAAIKATLATKYVKGEKEPKISDQEKNDIMNTDAKSVDGHRKLVDLYETAINLPQMRLDVLAGALKNSAGPVAEFMKALEEMNTTRDAYDVLDLERVSIGGTFFNPDTDFQEINGKKTFEHNIAQTYVTKDEEGNEIQKPTLLADLYAKINNATDIVTKTFKDKFFFWAAIKNGASKALAVLNQGDLRKEKKREVVSEFIEGLKEAQDKVQS